MPRDGIIRSDAEKKKSTCLVAVTHFEKRSSKVYGLQRDLEEEEDST